MTTRLRPNVLAHPSPTTGRFLLLIAALVSAGLLTGSALYTLVYQDEFIAAAQACFGRATGNSTSSLEELLTHAESVEVCMAPQHRADAAFSFAGAGAIGVLGVIVMLFVPMVLRRRRRLRPAGANMAAAVARVGELAGEAGLRKAPAVMVGPTGHRDAFVFGLPGRYRLVLPMALLVKWRNRELFDPVVRHELGHLRRHDVLMAWLAASVWLAAPVIFAVLLVPLAIDLDLSLLPHYLWRVGLLIGLVWLVRRQLLRSREHDADLFVARQMRDWRPLWKVLAATTGPAPGFWRRWISHHPAPAERQRVLVDPATAPGVSFVDGLVAAFLAGLFFPVLVRTIGTATGSYTWAPLFAGLIAGPLLGLAVGAGLWRQALIDHAAGTSRWPGGAVGGVITGLLLAYVTEFAYLVGDGEPVSGITITLIIVVGAGVVLLSASTGRLWADASAGLPAARASWTIGVTVNALLFGFAIWILGFLPPYLEVLTLIGTGLTDTVVVGSIISPITYLAIIPALVTMLALLARRKVANVPNWLIDSAHTGVADVPRKPGLGAVLVCGIAAGLMAAAGILMHRFAVGRPVDDADSLARYTLWLTAGTLVALAVSFVSVVAIPRSGGAIGLVAGAVTAMTAGFATVSINTFAFGNIMDLKFWWSTIAAITAQWFLGHLLLLPLTLVTWFAPWREVPGWLVTTITLTAAAVASILIAGVAIASWG